MSEVDFKLQGRAVVITGATVSLTRSFSAASVEPFTVVLVPAVFVAVTLQL